LRPGNGNQPAWANRPGAGGSGTQWGPGNGNRPWGIGDRPAIVNRPTNNIFNQQNNITNNQVTNIRQNNFNQTNINQNNFASVNRPWGYNNYHANWSDWHAGYWNNWHSCPSAWFGAGAATAAVGNWMFSPGASYAYSNPFYIQPTTVVDAWAPDYSQPIAVPAPVVNYVDNSSYAQNYVLPDESAQAPIQQPAAAEQSGSDQPTEASASQAPPEVIYEFDKARAAFKSGEYANALETTDQAIKGLPGDATLHEFRALVLFAQKKYKDAAAGTYAVLSVGPGMNWATMSGLYQNVETYQTQLRGLEAYVRENPKASDGRFLLAYHYLVLGYTEQAVKQLEYFSELVPSDKLAAELVKAFTQEPDTGKPKAQAG
jgi:tetratricopeptide (TPR) repeat protein